MHRSGNRQLNICNNINNLYNFVLALHVVMHYDSPKSQYTHGSRKASLEANFIECIRIECILCYKMPRGSQMGMSDIVTSGGGGGGGGDLARKSLVTNVQTILCYLLPTAYIFSHKVPSVWMTPEIMYCKKCHSYPEHSWHKT